MVQYIVFGFTVIYLILSEWIPVIKHRERRERAAYSLFAGTALLLLTLLLFKVPVPTATSLVGQFFRPVVKIIYSGIREVG